MPSYKYIQSQIDTSQSSSSGMVSWTGSKGVKVILSELNENVRDRGILLVEDVGTLGSYGGEDTYFAIVRDTGMYVFNPSGNGTSSSVPGMGGVWDMLTSFSFTSYYQKLIGNGSDTVYEIAHNMNRAFPSVEVWDSITMERTTGYTVYALDADRLRLEFPTAPSLNSKTVIVR